MGMYISSIQISTMEEYTTTPPTYAELNLWRSTNGLNPRTGGKIRKKTKLYELFKSQYKLMKKNMKNSGSKKTSYADDDDVDYSRSLLDDLSAKSKKKLGATKKKEPETLYSINGKSVKYDYNTMTTYAQARKAMYDMLTLCSIDNPKLAFKYPYMWDPYTGERIVDPADSNLMKDPYGPLCYDARGLALFFVDH